MSSDLTIIQSTLVHFNKLLTEKTARAPDKISKAKELIFSDSELSHDYNLLNANREVLKRNWQTLDTSASYSIALLVLFEHEIGDVSTSPHIEGLLIYLMKNGSPLVNEVMQRIEEKGHFSIQQIPLEKLNELKVDAIIKLLQLCEKMGDTEGIKWLLANVLKLKDNDIKQIMTKDADKPRGIHERLFSLLKEKSTPSLYDSFRRLDEWAATNPEAAQKKIAEILSSPTGNSLLKNIDLHKNLLHLLLTHPNLEDLINNENLDWMSFANTSLTSTYPRGYINFFMAMDHNPPIEEDKYANIKKRFIFRGRFRRLSRTQTEWMLKQSTSEEKKQIDTYYIKQYFKALPEEDQPAILEQIFPFIRKKASLLRLLNPAMLLDLINTHPEYRPHLRYISIHVLYKSIDDNDINILKSILSNPYFVFTGREIGDALIRCLRRENKHEAISILLRSQSFDKSYFDRTNKLISAFVTPSIVSPKNYTYLPVLVDYACEKMDVELIFKLINSKDPNVFKSISPDIAQKELLSLPALPIEEFKQAISKLPLTSVYLLFVRYLFGSMPEEHFDFIIKRLNLTLPQMTNLMLYYKDKPDTISYFLTKVQDEETRTTLLNRVNEAKNIQTR